MDDMLDVRTDVFSLREVARAAGVPLDLVRARVAAGSIRTIGGEFLAYRDAVAAVRLVSPPVTVDAAPPLRLETLGRTIFDPIPSGGRSTMMSLTVSSTLHAVVATVVVFVTSVGLASHEPEDYLLVERPPARLVFLTTPGPGGGGGGGGLKQPDPPARAEREGTERVSSPLPVREPPAPTEPPPPVEEPEPPVLEHEPLPPIFAPVIAAPADARDRPGVLDDMVAESASRGRGDGGGAGAGDGTGLGEGQGPGVGPGSGGGTGGGPYRPGSGIAPPALLHEVKAQYTEEARRRGMEGEVVLEIVILADGTVGNIEVLRGLGFGLDRQASEAVRRWRFRPAHRQGSPVDVIVEVAVEFSLR